MSQPPQDDTLSSALHESSTLTDINDIINAENETIIQQPAQLDKAITPSDNLSLQNEVEALVQENKRRKMNNRSKTSPVPEERE